MIDRAQVVAAGQRGNEVRMHRKKLRDQIAAGEVPLSKALIRPDPWLQKMPVRELILAVKGVGPTKADRILASCRLHSLKVGDLTTANRTDLLSELYGRYPAVRPRLGIGR